PAASTNALASAAAGFKLQSGSPALSEALSLASLFGLNNGGADYYGNTFSGTGATVAGADQSLRSGTTVNIVSGGSGTSGSTTSGSTTSGSTTSSSTPSGSTTTTTTTSPSLAGYDIGSVAAKGSNSSANGTYTVTARGADIWGTADAMRFDETSVSGNGTF